MNGLKLAALVSLLAGIGLLVRGFLEGSVRISLLLIFPIVHGTGVAAGLGMLLVVAGLVLWTLGTFREMGSARGALRADAPRDVAPAPVERRSGGMVLLGPIPIVWGSDRGVRKWMIAAGIAILVLWFLAVALLRG